MMTPELLSSWYFLSFLLHIYFKTCLTIKTCKTTKKVKNNHSDLSSYMGYILDIQFSHVSLTKKNRNGKKFCDQSNFVLYVLYFLRSGWNCRELNQEKRSIYFWIVFVFKIKKPQSSGKGLFLRKPIYLYQPLFWR